MTREPEIDQPSASVATKPPESYRPRKEEVMRALARSLGFPVDSLCAETKLNGLTAGWITRFAIRIWDDSREAAIRAIGEGDATTDGPGVGSQHTSPGAGSGEQSRPSPVSPRAEDIGTDAEWRARSDRLESALRDLITNIERMAGFEIGTLHPNDFGVHAAKKALGDPRPTVATEAKSGN